MIIIINDRNGNTIKFARIDVIRKTSDNMVTFYTQNDELTVLQMNGIDMLKSCRPTFDCRMIKNIEVLP